MKLVEFKVSLKRWIGFRDKRQGIVRKEKDYKSEESVQGATILSEYKVEE